MQLNHSAAHIDLLPTILELLEIHPEFAKEIDGISLKSGLYGQPDNRSRTLYQEWSGKKRVQEKNYLLINEHLYKLEDDPGQEKDLRNEMPEKYDQMLVDWKTWCADVTQEGFEVGAIPVGHPDFPLTVLPAHEANLYPPYEFRKDRRHTGIAYHALYGWAHDWIDYWTSTEVWVEWPVEVISQGNYSVQLFYNLDTADVGPKLEISCGKAVLKSVLDEPFCSKLIELPDRIKRGQEAPEKEWKAFNAGQLYLEKGVTKLVIRAIEIPGNECIELKEIHLTRID
jgi:hypothetical protein